MFDEVANPELDDYVVLADAPSDDDDVEFGDWDDAFSAELADRRDDAAGLDLAMQLAAADSVTRNGADAAGLLDRVAGWDRVVSWATAQRTREIAAFANHRPPRPQGTEPEPGHGPVGPRPLGAGARALTSEFTPDEVAAALCIAPTTAARWLGQALSLVHELPATLAAVEDGRISFATASVIEHETTGLSDEHKAVVEATVLAKAAGRSPGAVRDSTRRAAYRVDPVGTTTRRKEASRMSRGVTLRGFNDGTVGLNTVLGAEEGLLAFATLDAYAASNAEAGEEHGHRGLADRRADVLIDLITALRERRLPSVLGLDTSEPTGEPDAQSVRPVIRVEVVVGASTLLGRDEQPGEVTGIGPVPADVARALAYDSSGTWRRVLTGPGPVSPGIIQLSSRSYRPPPALRAKIRMRDRTCRFPGCRRRRADLDHTIPWPRGQTTESNLEVLCHHHHRLKHEAGWQLDQPIPGTLVWTSPTGRTYTVAPPDLPGDTTADADPEDLDDLPF